MKRLALIAVSFAGILGLSGFASAGTILGGPGTVERLVLLEADGAMRIGFNGPTPNPAGCDVTAGFALQLNAPGRSAEETRTILNNLQLAFMTRRPVSLYIRDDICYTIEGFPMRVVSGIIVTN